MKWHPLYCIGIGLLLYFTACDEGKIYPEEIIDTGRTATLTVTFTGLEAWPRENTLSLCSYSEDKSQPLLSKRITKPTREGKEVTITLNNLPAETRTIELAVISRGLKEIYAYYTYEVDNNTEEQIVLSLGELDLASFDRIQKQIFDLNCLSCHGESTSLAGNLDLREGTAYQSLVNVKAPLSEDGKNYITPNDIHDSFLLDILEDNPIHSDMFNSSGKQEVLSLIRGWISGGAENN